MPSLHPALTKLEASFLPAPVVQIRDPLLSHFGVSLWLKREDLLHPIISGNKWRKLKYNLNHALAVKSHTLVSMGGAYSNHLHALAYVARHLGLQSIGFIRGEQPAQLNQTLEDMLNWGMQLKFISRSEYRQLRAYKTWQALPSLQAGEYWLAEGGASTLALAGIAELVPEITQQGDYLCVACGTGSTLAGLIAATAAPLRLIGFAALKGADYLHTEVQQLLPKDQPYPHWQINLDYHLGGFGRQSAELLAFMQAFEARHAMPLDPVYTGKMLFGLYDLIAQGYFPAGTRIIAIHTGGLQGRRSLHANNNHLMM